MRNKICNIRSRTLREITVSRLRTHHYDTSHGNLHATQAGVRQEALLGAAFGALPGSQLPQNLGYWRGTLPTGYHLGKKVKLLEKPDLFPLGPELPGKVTDVDPLIGQE